MRYLPGQSRALTPPSAGSVASYSPSTPEPYYEEADEGTDWNRVLYAIRRHRWLVLGIVLLGLGVGAVLTRVIPSQYVVEATLWVEPRREPGPEVGPIRTERLLDEQAWVDLLKSYVVLDQVVRDQRLYLEPRRPADSTVLRSFAVAEEFRPGDYQLAISGDGRRYVLSDEDREIERGNAGDSIGRAVGIRWAPRPADLPRGQTVAFTLQTLRDAARSLAKNLKPAMDLEGNFMRLEMRGSDPVRLAAVVNAVANRYVQVAGDLKREKVTELASILRDQLDSSRSHLRRAEASLENFRVRTITLPSDRYGPGGGTAGPPTDPTFSTFFTTRTDRERLQLDREKLQAILPRLATSPSAFEALPVIESVRNSPDLTAALEELTELRAELRAQRYRYADEHPAVKKTMADIAIMERESIPAMIRALLEELNQRATVLDRQVATTERSLREIPTRAVEEARLQRDVQTAEELYTTLQQRYEEARLAEASTIPDVRVLDNATVPKQPITTLLIRIMLVSLVASIGVGVATAVLVDRADPRVRYPEQVTRSLGLPILGAVPHVKRVGRKPQPDAAERVQVIEALRGICLNLSYVHATNGSLMLTVTSPGAGDGKSFLSTNLALTFADGGRRTLVIDGDLRRGSLHHRLGINRRPGLTEYLRGEVPLDQIIQPTRFGALHVIPCGARAAEAPELLGSPAMAQLMDQVRGRYDVILCDSPPMGAGIDPFVLGTITGNLLLVLRTGVSHREVTQAKLQVLSRLPVQLLGAVLNDVPVGQPYGYYSYSLPGYTVPALEAEPPARG